MFGMQAPKRSTDRHAGGPRGPPEVAQVAVVAQEEAALRQERQQHAGHHRQHAVAQACVCIAHGDHHVMPVMLCIVQAALVPLDVVPQQLIQRAAAGVTALAAVLLSANPEARVLAAGAAAWRILPGMRRAHGQEQQQQRADAAQGMHAPGVGLSSGVSFHHRSPV